MSLSYSFLRNSFVFLFFIFVGHDKVIFRSLYTLLPTLLSRPSLISIASCTAFHLGHFTGCIVPQVCLGVVSPAKILSEHSAAIANAIIEIQTPLVHTS